MLLLFVSLSSISSVKGLVIMVSHLFKSNMSAMGCVPHFREGNASCSHMINYIVYVSLKLVAEVYTFNFTFLFYYKRKKFY